MTEIYKPVTGFPEYEVSNLGNVKSLRSGIILKVSSKTYQSVGFNVNGVRTKVLVHRLVGTHFIPNPSNKPFINHIDNDPTNNKVSNLEWCTQSENLQHAQNQGRLTAAQRKGGIVQAAKAKSMAYSNAIGLVGKVIGSWEVVSYLGLTPTGTVMRETLLCKCACGVEQQIHAVRLMSGTCTQCRQCTKYASSNKRALEIYAEYPVGTIIGTWRITAHLAKPKEHTVRQMRFPAQCTVCGNRTILTQPSVIGTKPIKKCEHCIKEMKI